MNDQKLRHQPGWLYARQDRHRRQCSTKVMRHQAQRAGMRRQTVLVVRRMPDGMGTRRQLGEEQDSNEQDVTQGTHGLSLIDLDE